MILRRFMKHVTDQNWFAVGLDVIVVVVGIFLGMQVTEWNQDREINNEVTIYKHRLINELKENITRLDNDIQYYQGVIDYAGIVYLDIDKPENELDEAFIVMAYQSTQRTGLRVANFTINEINSTGMLKYLNDIELRQNIQIYDNVIKTDESGTAPLTAYRINIRSILFTEIQDAIRAHCDDQVDFLSGDSRIILVKLNKDCKLELSEEVTRHQIKILKQYTNFKNDLSYRISDIHWKLTNLGVIKLQAEYLLSYLENNI
jgi:hypothetical protein